MKKSFAVLIILTMLLSLAGCGDKEEVGAGSNAPVAEAPAEAAPTEAPKTALISGEWSDDNGSYSVDVLGAELFTDDEDQQALRIWFDFTNNSNATVIFQDMISDNTQQDGESLPSAVTDSDHDFPEQYNRLMRIRPGMTVRCVNQKQINPDGGTVNLLYNVWGKNDEIVSYFFDLNNLPGAPKEELPKVTVSAPTWTETLPLEGDYEGKAYIRIISAEVCKDGDDNRALRVFFEFTNNSDKEVSMWRIADLWAIQDGVGAGNVWPGIFNEIETDDAFESAQPIGETVTVSCLFRLYTDSPLEVEIVDDQGGTGLGAVFYVAADDTVTIGEKNLTPEPTEAPAEPPAETPAEPAVEAAPEPVKPVKPASFTESFTISDNDSATVTVHYPDSFTYEPDYRKGSFLSHTPYVFGGALIGNDYNVDFAFVRANNYYETVEAYVKSFKGTDIYEEIEVAGFKAYVRQDMTSYLNIVIWLTETQMLNVEVAVPGDRNEEIYRPIWEGEIVPAIINNLEIKVEAVIGETVSTDYGYVTLTELDGWKKGEPRANFNLTLYNSGLGNSVWVDVLDLQLGELQQTLDILKSGYPNAVWTKTTVGSYTLHYLDCGNVSYLAGETSTGKPFYIEIRNCTLNEAASLLETMVIN